MAFTEAELKTWVDGLGLPDDKKAGLLATLGVSDVLAKVGESVMMRGEFSRKLDEMKATETRLLADFNKKVADEEKKTTDFVNSTGNWKKEKEAILNEAVAKREAAEKALAKVQEDIKNVATEYGIPEDKLPKVSTTMNSPSPSNNDSNNPPMRDLEGKFATREYIDGLSNNILKLPAIITRLDREYERLFGREAPLVDWEKIIDDARVSKRTLVQEFEFQFKVPEKRAELAKIAHDKEIETARNEGAAAERSKILATNPGLATNVRRDEHHGSPILERAAAQSEEARKKAAANGTPIPVVDEGRGVAAAVKAFREGKYKAA